MLTESGDRAADFAAAALAWLERDPVTNNIVATVTGAALTAGSPGSFVSTGDPFVWAIVRDADGEITGAAVCTPPYPVSLSAMSGREAEALAGRFAADGFAAVGVTGPEPAAEAFAARWAASAVPPRPHGTRCTSTASTPSSRRGDVPGRCARPAPATATCSCGWTRGFWRRSTSAAAPSGPSRPWTRA